jgi:hypothetical protein
LRNKSEQYIEGFNAGKNPAFKTPVNPYLIARPHKEDRVSAIEWLDGWNAARKKVTKTRKTK